MPEVAFTKFTKLSITVMSASFDVAVKLGFGLFDGQTDAQGRALLISVLLLGDDVVPHDVVTDSNGKERVVTYQRSAFGVRFAVKMTSAQASTRVSLGYLAATNDTSGSKVQLDKVGKGLSPELASTFADVGTELTATSLGGIRELISKEIPAHVRKVFSEGGRLGVNPIYEQAASLDTQGEYEPYKAINYGTTKVAQNIPLNEALRVSWLNDADRSVVSQVYARYGIVSGAPTVDQARQADEWLRAARKRKT